MPLETPVAFFVFNRPEPTRRVLAEIAKARPRKLLIVADGPRDDRPGEAERCAEVREIVEAVDWECTVLRNYAERNLGCRGRVSSGLDWVFSECEEAIVLEDDCLPDPTFFPYCRELLARYRDDERVMMVSGDDFLADPSSPYSYRFSRYNLIWGWATWRRAWRHYDVTLSAWPSLRDTGWLRRITGSAGSARYWREIFDRVHRGEIDTWDYQWMFTTWTRDGVSIVPSGNLVTNIGFGADATHTTTESRLANLPVRTVEFPLRHPPRVEPDWRADRVVAERVFEWVIPSRGVRMYFGLRARISARVPLGIRRAVRTVLRRPGPSAP